MDWLHNGVPTGAKVEYPARQTRVDCGTGLTRFTPGVNAGILSLLEDSYLGRTGLVDVFGASVRDRL